MQAVIIDIMGLWYSVGWACVAITARKMGYLRVVDLFLIPFGFLVLFTPLWWDESARKIWRAPYPRKGQIGNE